MRLRAPVGEAGGRRYLWVPEREVSWAEVLSAAMELAASACREEQPGAGCEEPWVTLWLASR